MEESKKYTTYQVHGTPFLFPSFNLGGAVVYFVFDYQWLAIIAAWLFIAVMTYMEKPLRFILLNSKLKLVSFGILISISLVSPALVVHLSGSKNEFIVMMLIAIGSLIIGVFLYFIYDEEILKQYGWVEKNKFN